MKERLQKGAIDTAQTLINLCKSMKDCSECPFAYWNDRYDKGIAHCTIGSPSDSWDINLASVKTESTEQSKPKKIVPFDLSLKGDRDALIGKVLYGVNTNEAMIITHIFNGMDSGWYADGLKSAQLFREFVFADTGKPVGKEVEE